MILKRYLVVYDLKYKRPVYEKGKRIIQYDNAMRIRALVDDDRENLKIQGYAKWTDGKQIINLW